MPDLKELIQSRAVLKGSLTRFKTFLDKHSAPEDLDLIVLRLANDEHLYHKFDDIQSQIEALLQTDDEIDTQQRERDSFEDTFFQLIGTAKSRIRDRDNEMQTIQQPSHSSITYSHPPTPSNAEVKLPIKLPTISLPIFDGSYETWLKFRDTFESLIHNREELSDIQRFHYLNAALTGDAARVISSLGVSDSNYALAWECLKNRYEDSKALINHHIKALFELQSLTKASYVGLRDLLDNSFNHLLALKALGEPTETWCTLLIHIISQKLDSGTKREWEKARLKIDNKPTFKEFTKVLETHCKYLELAIGVDQTKHNAQNNPRKQNVQIKSHIATNYDSCIICQESHNIYRCTNFLKLPLSERVKEVRKLRLCFNCLRPGHSNKNCTLGHCKKCSKKHNTLIHQEINDSDQSEIPSLSTNLSIHATNEHETSDNLPKTTSMIARSKDYNPSRVLLSTAIVYLLDRDGKKHECRALLDSDSQAHFITETMRYKLNLPTTKIKTNVSGIEQTGRIIDASTQVTLISKFNGFKAPLICLIMPKITDYTPNIQLGDYPLNIPVGIPLSDPYFYEPRDIDLLIGAGLFWELLCVGQIKMKPQQPLLQKTQLGWIIAGSIKEFGQKEINTKCHLITNQQLHNSVERFWELEHCTKNYKPTQLDPKDPSEQHFISTISRDQAGRFIVSIPFHDKLSELGQSREMAMKRFESLERKLNKSPELRSQYTNFMMEYESLGHMTEVTQNDKDTDGFYLPHHAVIKESSTTTKLRVVFDGSAKSTSGISLNDTQRIGYKVQDDLFCILIRYRKWNFVLSADVAKMYRQIWIKPEERKFQQILWRNNSNYPIRTYKLNTVTYGTGSAPFLATRVLRQIGEEVIINNFNVGRAIIKDFYVDDLLSGADTIEEAIQLKNDISSTLQDAGLILRKWTSNDSRVVMHNEDKYKSIESEQESRTLGLLWNIHADTLGYLVKPNSHKHITKRNILSTISQIFDPLGLVGPATIQAKLILQRLWQLQTDWDESLPQDLHHEWKLFYTQLPCLNQLQIDRKFMPTKRSNIQLHGFCDASEKAYGACLYVRCKDNKGNCTIKLLCAKSRVAPLKSVSLPRLELSGALLLAKLYAQVSTALDMKIDEQHFWTDSTITLAWISSPPNKWKTFVANRTAEIQELTNKNWHHVASADNPADVISRGTSPSELCNHNLWWNGPDWLAEEPTKWPLLESQPSSQLEDIPETKATVHTLITTEEDITIFEKYTPLRKLTRIVAYCRRFIMNSRTSKISRQNGPLTVDELSQSLMKLIQKAQRKDFPKELDELKSSSVVSKNSRIRGLNPFIDGLGYLRVGGRLNNAMIPYGQKHPIILSQKGQLTKLIIQEEHQKLMHAGSQAVVASLRTRYWPIAAKTTVKKIIKGCIKCFRTNPVPMEYVMGNLPSARVNPAPVFYACGVDYAGPFFIKDKPRSRTFIKCYICIFVCFAVKAVHIELAVDLSTDAFLKCLRRFIARRNMCRHIYSDNGTNFVGANHELQELKKLMESQSHKEDIANFLANENIQWHFIPPNAPNFGGLWESAVKSAKTHLKRVIGENKLTYEEFYTVLTQIEACMNSRPLSPLSQDPNDLVPLTPGHFLTGTILCTFPEPDLKHINEGRLDRYQHLVKMLQHFWDRWSMEYLHQLQQRHKWTADNQQKLAAGTMVVVKDDNLPALKWRLGRISALHPGKDGVIRVVAIKVSGGVITRPLSKICVLPFED